MSKTLGPLFILLVFSAVVFFLGWEGHEIFWRHTHPEPIPEIPQPPQTEVAVLKTLEMERNHTKTLVFISAPTTDSIHVSAEKGYIVVNGQTHRIADGLELRFGDRHGHIENGKISVTLEVFTVNTEVQ